MSSHNYHYLFKYILVGDSNVGKSSLLMRFLKEKFIDNYEPTLGVQFGSKMFKVDNMTIKAMVWDTAGQQSFKSIIKTYYKGAIIAILMYDSTNLLSYQNLVKWVQQITNNSHEYIRIVLVANKIDLSEKRQVSQQMGRQLSEKNQFQYIQASAKSGVNVEQVFSIPAKSLVKALKQKQIVLNPHLNIGIKVGSPQNYELQRQDQYNHSSFATQLKQKSKKEQEQCKC